MADVAYSDLPKIPGGTSAPHLASADIIPYTDSSDQLTSGDSAGTTKGILFSQLLLDLAASIRLSAWLAANADVDFDGQRAKDIGILECQPVARTIDGSGEIAYTATRHRVAVASGTTDNLDGITGGADGELLILSAANVAHTVTVRHNQNNGLSKNILLNGGVDFDIAAAGTTITLMFDAVATCWVEVARSIATTGGAPSGAAGGDLAGTYPNPQVNRITGTGTIPTASGDAGNDGDVEIDGDYIYFHNGTQWLRALGTAF